MSEKHEFSEGHEESIAKKKLAAFYAVDQAAIRYINEGEYLDILQSGIKPDMETNLVDMRELRDALLKGNMETMDWLQRAQAQTNWHVLGEDLYFAGKFLMKLQTAREKVRGQIGDMRSLTVVELANMLQSDLKLRWESGQHARKVVDEMVADPKSIDRSKLRDLLNRGSRKVATERDEHAAPYHILVVFDPSAVDLQSNSYGRDAWKLTRKSADPHSLIGAFSMLPQKDLYQDMIQAASHAGELAHPIFDARGVVRWPHGS